MYECLLKTYNSHLSNHIKSFLNHAGRAASCIGSAAGNRKHFPYCVWGKEKDKPRKIEIIHGGEIKKC